MGTAHTTSSVGAWQWAGRMKLFTTKHVFARPGLVGSGDDLAPPRPQRERLSGANSWQPVVAVVGKEDE